MTITKTTALALLTAALLGGAAHPAAALTEKECSTKYQAAKSAGTLAGADWKSFRATQCGSTATAAATPVATVPAATTAPVATTPVTPTPAPAAVVAPTKTPATAPVVKEKPAAVAQQGSAVFPDKIDPKYASLKGGKARMKTCDAQYQANKATGGNAGMKWIEKGGGYYSACSKHLKAI